jgi:hypothetical protein
MKEPSTDISLQCKMRSLLLVALRLGLTDSQRNPRAANRSRSFHGDNQALASLTVETGRSNAAIGYEQACFFRCDVNSKSCLETPALVFATFSRQLAVWADQDI